MKPKTELMLYMLGWVAGKAFSRSFERQLEGFEQWAYRNGLLRRIHELETKAFIERSGDGRPLQGFLKLTEAGMKAALGGRDPERAWDAPWDGKWRLFLFDLPSDQHALRKHFLRALRSCGCGWLQQSVWISPVLPEEMTEFLNHSDDRPGALILLEALSRGPELDRLMVEDAWDFEKVAKVHAELAAVLADLPENPSISGVLEWAQHEQAATKRMLAVDPLLPRKLCPLGYKGFEVWEKRRKTQQRAFEAFNATDS